MTEPPGAEAWRAVPGSTEPSTLSAEDVASSFQVDPANGLSAAEAARRREVGGPNELDVAERVSPWGAIVEAATEPFVLLLALAGGLALVLGEIRDGLLVLAGLIPIIGADVVTEYRAERALEELRDAAAPTAEVRRDGRQATIAARDLVPGDVVLLRTGDVVPADLRVRMSASLTLDRSVLTGESLPEPTAVAPDASGAALVDRRAMAYAATAVVGGRGEGIVTAVGKATEVGRIAAHLAPRERSRSPLQREMDRLVRILLVVAIALITITVSLALARGATIGAALLAGIAAAIAAIPEEPPVLLAVVLGLGAYRLLRKGVLVRRLNAQETLGSIDLIITDKTGTLTENRLRLEEVRTLDGALHGGPRAAVLGLALRAEADAWAGDADKRRGSFSSAIIAALGGRDAASLDPADLLHAEPPGDGRTFCVTRVIGPDGEEELALGAPEAILALGDDGSRPDWERLIAGAAATGQRLLLLARRGRGSSWRPRAVLAFADPLRSGVPAALREARAAGIQTIVVTGDHPITASTIARAAGLGHERVVLGAELAALDDAAVRDLLPHLEVVARATPEQKLRLVSIARAAGRTVAVTGDGVNDAPALQRADVAVAMGSGTTVAREAADLVLGDDSFVTLIDGLREGRRIVANVQKGLVFLTSTHVALLGFILIASLVGFGQPLLPIQILWLELFIDLATAVAFEREPAEPDAMTMPPRSRDVPLLTSSLLGRIMLAGGLTALIALAVMIGHGGDGDHVRWLAFNVLVFGQLVRASANRSLTVPLHRLSRNGFLVLASLAAAAIQLAIPFVPLLGEAFRASPLSVSELLLVLVAALAPALVGEAARSLHRGEWVA